MIIAINFADSNFELQRKYNTQTAYSKGKVDRVIEYSPLTIDECFKEENKSILSNPRGAGLWLWKPYFILKTLNELSDGDYLFYCDSGAFFVNKVQYLIDALNQQGQSIMGFELPLLERQFTKRESFELMQSSDYSRNQILATYMLFKKDDFSVQFVEEWLKYASDERIISPDHFFSKLYQFEDFRVHREDQSIFSILYYKYNLKGFREPSQYGDRPWEHIWIPAFSWSKPWLYRLSEFTNSDYPRILVGCRSNNPRVYKIKEYIKNIFNRMGLYNESVYVHMKKAHKNIL